MTNPWRDNAERYGRVTRWLHWTIAAVLAWQFAGMAIKLIVGRAPITAFWVGSHVSVGTLLFALIAARLVWALVERPRRPPHASGLVGRAAPWGHRLLYTLMLVVPTLALVRHLGAGRDLAPFGLMLIPGDGNRIDWLTAPADALHAPLAWLLLALIAGHVAMVAVHHFAWRDDTARRMIGRGRVSY